MLKGTGFIFTTRSRGKIDLKIVMWKTSSLQCMGKWQLMRRYSKNVKKTDKKCCNW